MCWKDPCPQGQYGYRFHYSPGNVQRMSAGTGVQHSEFNPSQTEKVHFLQIWFIPNALGLTPSYEEKYFDDAEKRGKLRLIASPDGTDGSVKIHSDAKMFAALLEAGERLSTRLRKACYVYIARGNVSLNDTPLHSGDGAMLTGEEQLIFDQGQNPEVLVFELGLS